MLNMDSTRTYGHPSEKVSFPTKDSSPSPPPAQWDQLRRRAVRQSRRISLPVMTAKGWRSSVGLDGPARAGEAVAGRGNSPGIDMGRAEPSFGRTIKRMSVASYGHAGEGTLDMAALTASGSLLRPAAATIEEEGNVHGDGDSSRVGGLGVSPSSASSSFAGLRLDISDKTLKAPHRSPASRSPTSIARLPFSRPSSAAFDDMFVHGDDPQLPSQRSRSPLPPAEEILISSVRVHSVSPTPSSASSPRLDRGLSAASVEAEASARAHKRRQVAMELVETERRYFAVLKGIKAEYYDPVWRGLGRPGEHPPDGAGCSPRPLLTKQVAMEIFANFEDVFGLSQTILAALEDTAARSQLFAGGTGESENESSVRKRPSLRVGATLLPLVPFLKLYAPFARGFPRSQAALALHASPSGPSPAFAALEAAALRKCKLTLSHLLLNVIQRVPRYELLLTQLLRYTDSSDRDYSVLTTVRDQVTDIARQLDLAMKEEEERLKLVKLQGAFDDWPWEEGSRSIEGNPRISAPGRRLLKSGRLRARDKGGQEKERMFFLFSDSLLYAVVRADDVSEEHRRYSNSQLIALDDLTAVAISARRKRTGSETRPAFQILSPADSFAILASTEDEKQEWLNAIRQAKAEHMGSRSTLLRSDDDVPTGTALGLTSPSSNLSSPSFGWSSWLGGRTRSRLFSRPTSFAASSSGSADRSQRSPEGRSWFSGDNRPGSLVVSSESSSSRPASSLMLDVSPSLGKSTDRLDMREFDDPAMREVEGSTLRFSTLALSPTLGAASQPRLMPGPPPFPADASQDEKAPLVIEDYSAPVWVPDDETVRCAACFDTFSLWLRRHHCRLCGDVFCANCSSKTFLASRKDNRPLRACNACYDAASGTLASCDSRGAKQVSMTPLLSTRLEDFSTLGRHFSRHSSGEAVVQNYEKIPDPSGPALKAGETSAGLKLSDLLERGASRDWPVDR